MTYDLLVSKSDEKYPIGRGQHTIMKLRVLDVWMLELDSCRLEMSST